MGKFDVYVNGTLAMSKKSRKLGSEGYYSSVATSRLAFYTDGSVDTEFYIHNGTIDVVNDFDIATYDFGLASLTDTDKYIVRNGSFIAKSGTVVSDITSDEHTVGVYTYADGVYTAVPADNALSEGDIVIAQKKDTANLEIAYYTVSNGIEYAYSNNSFKLSNSSVSAGTGIGGKASDDSSAAAEAGKDVFLDTHTATNGLDGADNVFVYTFKGYKVISVNMFITDNSQGGNFRITGQYGSIYTGDINVSNLVPNRWNKVDFVLKMDATYGAGYDGTEPETLTTTLYNGTASTYVNGALVVSGKKHAYGGWVKAGGSDPIRNGYTLRVGYNGLPQDVEAYIDDYSSYYSYFEPELDSVPSLSGDMVSNGFVYAEESATLADVLAGVTKADSDTMNVYSISGSTYTLAEDYSALAIGNTIVVTNPENRIAYYDIISIADAKSDIYATNFDLSPDITAGNATRIYTASLAGKGDSDYAFGLGVAYLTGAGGVVADESSISGYIDKNGAPVTADNYLVDEEGNKKPSTNSDRFIAIDAVEEMGNFAEISKLKGYKVVSVNVMYTGKPNGENLRISSNNSASVSGLIPLRRLQPNQWNRVDFVIEMQGDKVPPSQKIDGQIIEVSNGICSTYVNGRKIMEHSSSYGSYIWHYALDNYSSCSAFRIGFGIGADSDVVGYIDDYTSYFTPFAPDMTAIEAAPYAIMAQSGDALPTGEGVAVYTDATCSQPASGVCAMGNVIVTETVTDSTNGIKRYGYCALNPITVTETENGINVSSTYTEGTLVIAEYRLGELVNAQVYNLADTSSMDYAPEGTNEVKIIVLESNTSLKPVSDYIRY